MNEAKQLCQLFHHLGLVKDSVNYGGGSDVWSTDDFPLPSLKPSLMGISTNKPILYEWEPAELGCRIKLKLKRASDAG